MTPDFEFQFGQTRYLRGRGWLEIIALALLLAAAVLTGSTVFGFTGAELLHLMSVR